MARVPVQHLNLHIRPHFPHKVGVLACIACWRACLRNVRHTAVPCSDKAVEKSGPPCSDKDAVKRRFIPGLSFRPLRSPSAEGILSNPFVEVWAPPGRIRTAGACCKHQQPNVTASLVTSAPADINLAHSAHPALLLACSVWTAVMPSVTLLLAVLACLGALSLASHRRAPGWPSGRRGGAALLAEPAGSREHSLARMHSLAQLPPAHLPLASARAGASGASARELQVRAAKLAAAGAVADCAPVWQYTWQGQCSTVIHLRQTG